MTLILMVNRRNLIKSLMMSSNYLSRGREKRETEVEGRKGNAGAEKLSGKALEYIHLYQVDGENIPQEP